MSGDRITRSTLVKVLGPNGEVHHGGSGVWHLPSDGKPGKWMPTIRNPKLCERGYHGVTVEQLIPWLGPTLWRMEGGRAVDADAGKSSYGRARLLSRIEAWDDRTARLFACDCAERVLRLFESQFPSDERPRAALKVARDYANGLLTLKHLGAAGSAARSAAESAAWSAEWSAACSAADAAGSAACSAADVAWSAACSAACSAADAAGSAACSAADAAWSAAWSAAKSAARRAERDWQIDRLLKYLNGEVVTL